jgi:Immunoglobulin I-set domain
MRNVQKPGLEIATTNLTIYSAQNGTDIGSYQCLVRDHLGHTGSSTKFISVIPVGAGFIKLREDSGKYESEVVKGKTAQFVATYLAAPEADFEWFNNKNELITEVNDKYELKKTDRQLHLRIKNPDLSDAGRYRLIGRNRYDNKTIDFYLKVADKPTVHVESVEVQEGDFVKMTCECVGYPESVLTYSFEPCQLTPKWPTCGIPIQPSLQVSFCLWVCVVISFLNTLIPGQRH